MKKYRRHYLAVILCILTLISSLLSVSAAVEDSGPTYDMSEAVMDETIEEETMEEKSEAEESAKDGLKDSDEDNKKTGSEEKEVPEDIHNNQDEVNENRRDQDVPGHVPGEKESEEDAEEKETILEKIAGPDGPCFSIQSDKGRFQRSVDNGSKLQVNSVRYDKFYGDVGIGSYDNPQLGMGIKYIEYDNETPDADGKWRYVYCLNFKKSSPTGQNMTYQGGWTSRKIAYCLYYGAMFWQQPCRYAKYRTGDWQLDYFVTQTAIHVLNGEFSLSGAFGQIDRSSQATANEKALAKDRINMLVSHANDGGNYASFTQDGWFDASAQAAFSVTTPSDFAAVTDGYATVLTLQKSYTKRC